MLFFLRKRVVEHSQQNVSKEKKPNSSIITCIGFSELNRGSHDFSQKPKPRALEAFVRDLFHQIAQILYLAALKEEMVEASGAAKGDGDLFGV